MLSAANIVFRSYDVQGCLGSSSNVNSKRGKGTHQKAQSTPTLLPWPAQHQFSVTHRSAMQKTQIMFKQRKYETTLRLLRHRSGRRDGLTSRLLGDRCCGCGLALANVALGGRDGVVVLLCPGRGLGPLGILPCFEQSVSSRIDNNPIHLNLQGPSSLSSQPPGQVHSPPNCLGRFSLGICARSSFW